MVFNITYGCLRSVETNRTYFRFPIELIVEYSHNKLK